MSSIHLPNAVESAPDVAPINRPTAPLLEEFHLSRRSRPSVLNVTDTAEVKAQLERIATLLDEGFKRSAEKRKMVQFSANTSGSHQYNRTDTTLPQLTLNKQSYMKENTMYTSVEQPAVTPLIGGEPITLSLATSLRRLVYGSTVYGFSKEWRRAAFLFKTSPFPYGLITEKTGARGLLLCVQGCIIRHLVFRYKTRDEILNRGVLDPTPYERTRALCQALAQILWRAGEHRRCCICLIQDMTCFNYPDSYRPDHITEKLHLFEFRSLEETEKFIRKYLYQFEANLGCILFLYSLVLSRTISSVYQDLGGECQLLSDYEEVTRPLVNLLLTGRASPYTHNGKIAFDELGELLERPLVGIPERTEVGYLYWSRDEDPKYRTMIGSMLRTPKYPIWVTHVNGTFGLLFGLNPDLMGDWRTEHRFMLRYYTGLASQCVDTKLTVETRLGRKMRAKTAKSRQYEEAKIPALEQCIMTKYYGAEIDWNGQIPFV